MIYACYHCLFLLIEGVSLLIFLICNLAIHSKTYFNTVRIEKKYVIEWLDMTGKLKYLSTHTGRDYKISTYH